MKQALFLLRLRKPSDKNSLTYYGIVYDSEVKYNIA